MSITLQPISDEKLERIALGHIEEFPSCYPSRMAEELLDLRYENQLYKIVLDHAAVQIVQLADIIADRDMNFDPDLFKNLSVIPSADEVQKFRKDYLLPENLITQLNSINSISIDVSKYIDFSKQEEAEKNEK